MYELFPIEVTETEDKVHVKIVDIPWVDVSADTLKEARSLAEQIGNGYIGSLLVNEIAPPQPTVRQVGESIPLITSFPISSEVYGHINQHGQLFSNNSVFYIPSWPFLTKPNEIDSILAKFESIFTDTKVVVTQYPVDYYWPQNSTILWHVRLTKHATGINFKQWVDTSMFIDLSWPDEGRATLKDGVQIADVLKSLDSLVRS